MDFGNKFVLYYAWSWAARHVTRPPARHITRPPYRVAATSTTSPGHVVMNVSYFVLNFETCFCVSVHVTLTCHVSRPHGATSRATCHVTRPRRATSPAARHITQRPASPAAHQTARFTRAMPLHHVAHAPDLHHAWPASGVAGLPHPLAAVRLACRVELCQKNGKKGQLLFLHNGFERGL